MIYLVIVKNPLKVKETSEEKQLEFIPNNTLEEYIKSVTMFEKDSISISVNGEEEKDLSRVLKDKDFVVVCPRVEKSTLGIIAMVALSFYTAGIVGATGGVFGAMNATWQAISAMAILTIGGMLITSVFGLGVTPGTSETSDSSTTYGWDTQDNLTTQGGAYPITYGTVRVTGQIIAQHVYSSDDNDDQYLNFLLCGGEGEVDYVSDILIDDNPISYYDDVTSEIRLGTNTQTSLDNFSQTYSDQTISYELVTYPSWSNNTSYAVGDIINPNSADYTYVCTKAGESGTTSPSFPTSGSVTDNSVIWEYRGSMWSTAQVQGNGGTSLQALFECANGLYYSNDNGGLDNTSVSFCLQIREVGATDWSYALSNGYLKLVFDRKVSEFVPSASSAVVGGSSVIDASVPAEHTIAQVIFYIAHRGKLAEVLSIYDWNTRSGECQFNISKIELVGNCYLNEVFTIKVTEVTSNLVHASTSSRDNSVYANVPTKLGVYSSIRGYLGEATPNVYYRGSAIAFLATSQSNPIAVTYDSKGNYNPTSGGQSYVGDSYTMTVSKVSATPNTASYTMTDNTQDAVRKTVTVNGLSESKNYELRAKCTYKNGTTSRYSNRLYWTTISQVFNDKYTYPNSVLVGIRALANDQLSGRKPSISWIQSRTKVYIWNPYTGAYEVKRADNPAWASYDALHKCRKIQNTNTGVWEYTVEGISAEYFIYDEFLAWATYCDDNTLDVNIHFDTTDEIWTQLAKIEEMGRGKVIRRGTRYGCMCDSPSDMVQLFTVSNIFKDSFTEEFLSLNDRATCVEVSFFNEEKDYVEDVVTVYDSSYDDTNLVVNPAQKTFYGCTTYDRAVREGAYIMRLTNNLIRTVGIEVDIDAIACNVGDVIGIQHDVPTWGMGGRIVSYLSETVDDVTTTTLTLDKEVSLTAGKDYTILCRVVDTVNIKEVFEYSTFTATTTESTHTITLETPFDIAPEEGTLFTFGESDKYVKKFRILNITRTQELKRTIYALEYSPEVYDEDDVISEATSYTPLASKTAVTDLVATPYFSVSSTGVVLSEIRTSWKIDKTSAPNYYMIYAYGDNGEDYSAKVYSTSYTFSNIKMGTYEIKVCAMYGLLVKSTTIYGVDITEKTSPPNDIETLVLIQDTDYPHVLHISWDANVNYDLKNYEIRVGSEWDTATLVANTTEVSYDYVIENSGGVNILVKALDTSGNYSTNSASSSITMVGANFDDITGVTVVQLD